MNLVINFGYSLAWPSQTIFIQYGKIKDKDFKQKQFLCKQIVSTSFVYTAALSFLTGYISDIDRDEMLVVTTN